MYKQAFKTYKEIFPIISIVSMLLSITIHLIYYAGTLNVIAVLSFMTATTFLVITYGFLLKAISGIAFSIIAFHAHQSILRNDNVNYNWAFLSKFLVIFISPFLVSILIFFTMSLSLKGLTIITLISTLSLGITVPLLGSALPAASVNADSTFSTALKRGKPHFWRTLWKLIYGPCFVFIVLSIAFNFIEFPSNRLPVNSFIYTLLQIIWSFAFRLLSAFPTILVASVLSHQFLEASKKINPKNDILGH